MKHLHLLVPDLFPPQDIAVDVCANMPLPALEKLLARSTVSASACCSLEEWLCAAFAANGVAPVRATADRLPAGEGYWLCADPVSLQLQRAQMLLLPDVAPAEEETAALCANLNAHFAGMGMHFYAPHSRRWYVRLDSDPQLTTTPLRQVAWRDAIFHQPQGIDALRWQRIMTELQMLLYAYPTNQAREARGEPLINSLWFWGGGRAVPLHKAFEAVGGDSELAGAFALAAAVPQIESWQAMLDGEFDNGLWLCAQPGEALQRGDFYAWREAVQRFEREYAQPVLKALRAGRLQRLTLEVLRENGSQRFELTRRDAWKLWRGARPLSYYAV